MPPPPVLFGWEFSKQSRMTIAQQGVLAVTKFFSKMALAVVVTLLVSGTSFAQVGARPPVNNRTNPGTFPSNTRGAASATSPYGSSNNVGVYHIAVVDITNIFKNHARFKASMESMKQQMKGIEQGLNTKKTAIQQKEKQRDGYKVGTNEYMQVDNQVTQMKADFTVEMTRLQKGFLVQESQVYYRTYLEVQDAIKLYAQKNNIGLVMRFNSIKIDPSRREDILRGINKPVVYNNQIDITADIIATVNRGAGTARANPATRAPVRGATAPGRRAVPR